MSKLIATAALSTGQPGLVSLCKALYKQAGEKPVHISV